MKFPSWLTWYKKPEYRDIREYSNAVGSGRRPLSPDGRGKAAVPSRLKLDRVLQNKTCSPMSLYDFYMYLKHIEYSAENLEFYIWFQNYETNWSKSIESLAGRDYGSFLDASPSQSSFSSIEKLEGSLSHEFSADPEAVEDTRNQISSMISQNAMCTAKSCTKPSLVNRVKNLSAAPPTCEVPRPTILNGPNPALHLTYSDPAHREELNAIIKLFLVPGSEKELNIPPAMREIALMNLQASSDPAHLRPIADHVYQLLRNCSHRNFVRLGVSNGTYETVCVATGLGIVMTCAGLLYLLVRAFVPGIHTHSRWDAFGAWPLWWIGISLILSGLRGSCFFLLLFSRRQPLPWERFDDSASIIANSSGFMKIVSRLMIFDRKLRVKDDHLRALQRKIVLQSVLGGAAFATLGVGIFVFLPIWSDFHP